jgi:uncharacterized membrane protein YcaP (DUF421 family)
MSTLWSLQSFPWWHFVVRAVVVYAAVMLLLRITGKRAVGQLGVPQLVGMLLLSNAVQNSLNGGDNSLTGRMILAGTLALLTFAFTFATHRSTRLRNLLLGRPTPLFRHGHFRKAGLRREHMTRDELIVLVREQGFSLRELREDVDEVILESDGKLSVIHKSDHPLLEQLEHHDTVAG